MHAFCQFVQFIRIGLPTYIEGMIPIIFKWFYNSVETREWGVYFSFIEQTQKYSIFCLYSVFEAIKVHRVLYFLIKHEMIPLQHATKLY